MVAGVDAEDQEADRQRAEEFVVVEFDWLGVAGVEQIILAARRESTAGAVIVLRDVQTQFDVLQLSREL